MIDRNDPQLYEHLGIIIDEYERAALLSGTREGLLATAHGPLTGMDMVLSSSDMALQLGELRAEKEEPSLMFPPETLGFEYDADLVELLGGQGVSDYFKNCLNCELGIDFDWQIQPINLLAGLNDLIGSIDSALDRLVDQLNPFDKLAELCHLLDEFSRNWCLADLIRLLMALKLALQQYLTMQLDIKVDWTVILGPLLKMIVEAIASLVEQLAQVLLAPLECLEGALSGSASAMDELYEIGALAKQLGSVQLVPELTRLDREMSVDTSGSTPALRTQTVDNKLGDGASGEVSGEVEIPVGLHLKVNTLSEAMAHPDFNRTHIFAKMLFAVRSAKDNLEELVASLLRSIRSVEGLVGGGLSMQLDGLGVLLFLKDMIGVVMLIIRMLKSGGNIKDWCSYLEENSEGFSEELDKQFGSSFSGGLKAKRSDGKMLIMKGPQVVGQVETCVSTRSSSERELLTRWLEELKQ